MQPFEIIDHTADVGLEAHGATLEELFANAALGMFSIIGGAGKVSPRETREVSVEADDRELLLVAFLAELLYVFEVDRFVPHHVEVRHVSETTVTATEHGEVIAPHHEFHTEIKAVTHHGLSVEQDGDAWRATVLFDI